MSYAEESLKRHGEWKGKIEVVSRVPVSTKEDLLLSPQNICDQMICY